MTGRAGAARLAWLGMMILALAACMGPRVAGTGGEGEPLAGTRWTLSQLNGQAPVRGLGDATPTLEFAAGEPRASGNGGCNQFSGPYTQDGASLRFGPLVSTRRACADEAANRQETAYLRALESTTRFTATAELLTLYAGDQAVAQLSRTAE
jgi:heat shock protein HslJ